MTIDEPHSLEEEQEKKQPWEFVKWIFRVLYSPMKTFEEIVEKPNIKGPVLILLITLPLILGGQYISGTKFFLETPTPENDLWTESVGNSTSFLWNSNDNVTLDSYDCIVGNYSVSSSFAMRCGDSQYFYFHDSAPPLFRFECGKPFLIFFSEPHTVPWTQVCRQAASLLTSGIILSQFRVQRKRGLLTGY